MSISLIYQKVRFDYQLQISVDQTILIAVTVEIAVNGVMGLKFTDSLEESNVSILG
jgi:hypothetical protein